MGLMLNQNLNIISQVRSAAVEHALDDLRRDIQNTCEPTADPGIQLLLEQEALGDECFLLIAVKEKNQLKLSAGSDLGFVYGIYEISRNILGVTDFWFWNDQEFKKREAYPVPEDFCVSSKPFPVHLRGWFVNDEVLLKTWAKRFNSRVVSSASTVSREKRLTLLTKMRSSLWRRQSSIIR